MSSEDLYRKSEVTESICKRYEQCGKSNKFLDKCSFHMETMKYFAEMSFKTRRQYNEILLSKLFLDKLDIYEEKPTYAYEAAVPRTMTHFSTVETEYIAPIVPFEDCLPGLKNMDLKKKRLMNFYENLSIGDVLLAKVIGSTNQEYKLRVLAKYRDYKKIDDLGILVHLSKSPDELQALGKELKESTVIRGVVHKYLITGLKVNLSVMNTAMVNKELLVKLGEVSEDDLIFLSWKCPGNSSATNFHICATKPCDLERIKFKVYEKLHLDPYKTESFIKKLNKKCDPSKSAKPLIHEMKNSCSNSCLTSALNFAQKMDIVNAFVYFEKSLKIQPANSKAYLKRGSMYYNMYRKQDNRLNRKALLDWENGLTLLKSQEVDCRSDIENYLNILLFSAARDIKDRSFDTAQAALDAVLSIDAEHKTALRYQGKLNKSKEIYLNNQPLDALEAQKRELTKELCFIVE